MTACMKMTAIWDIGPCSLVGVDRRFRGAYCLCHNPDEVLMEVVRTSEMSVYSKETTRRYSP
jgi:hypothetical protein